MQRRLPNILLLASFVYWTTGLAQCLHERFEHPRDAANAAAEARPAKNGAKPFKEADDHDDCPTCQSLKAMKAHSPDSPKVPEPALPSVETISTSHWLRPVLSFVVFIPARAPPKIAT